MSGSLLVWLFLAMLMFWTVGVYRRLVRLRLAGVTSFGVVGQQLRQYAGVVKVHLGTSVESEISPDWAALLGALTGLDAALKDAQREPLAASSLLRLGAAFESVQMAWTTLCDMPLDLAGPVVPQGMRQQWDAVTAAVHSVRSGCNQTLFQYNAAIEQFPARLLVGMMRFKTAGQL
jgi:LemA protein